jgi:P-type Ca2+ transporter type 2B
MKKLRVIRAFRSNLEDLEERRSVHSLHSLRSSRSTQSPFGVSPATAQYFGKNNLFVPGGRYQSAANNSGPQTNLAELSFIDEDPQQATGNNNKNKATAQVTINYNEDLSKPVHETRI